jgi:hypothetical protein
MDDRSTLGSVVKGSLQLWPILVEICYFAQGRKDCRSQGWITGLGEGSGNGKGCNKVLQQIVVREEQ